MNLYFDADPDPDPIFTLNADPDPGASQNNADLWGSVSGSATLIIITHFTRTRCLGRARFPSKYF
jgi:hypothetical protein